MNAKAVTKAATQTSANYNVNEEARREINASKQTAGVRYKNTCGTKQNANAHASTPGREKANNPKTPTHKQRIQNADKLAGYSS